MRTGERILSRQRRPTVTTGDCGDFGLQRVAALDAAGDARRAVAAPPRGSLEFGYPEQMGVRYPDSARRRERLESACREILPRIIDEDTERVILFGSTARGDVGSRSDLDLLVVRRDTRRPAERTTDLYRRARPCLAMDILVYTPEELDLAREESSFVRQILREGRIVYDRSQPLV